MLHAYDGLAVRVVPLDCCQRTMRRGRCGALSRGQDGTRRRTEIRVKVGLQLLGRRSAGGIGERRPDNLLDPPVVDINAWAEPHGGRPGGHRHASGPSRPDTSPLPSSTAHMVGRPLPLRDRRQLHHPDVAEREREKEKKRTRSEEAEEFKYESLGGLDDGRAARTGYRGGRRRTGCRRVRSFGLPRAADVHRAWHVPGRRWPRGCCRLGAASVCHGAGVLCEGTLGGGTRTWTGGGTCIWT